MKAALIICIVCVTLAGLTTHVNGGWTDTPPTDPPVVPTSSSSSAGSALPTIEQYLAELRVLCGWPEVPAAAQEGYSQVIAMLTATSNNPDGWIQYLQAHAAQNCQQAEAPIIDETSAGV